MYVYILRSKQHVALTVAFKWIRDGSSTSTCSCKQSPFSFGSSKDKGPNKSPALSGRTTELVGQYSLLKYDGTFVV